jgi:hypothetical protein
MAPNATGFSFYTHRHIHGNPFVLVLTPLKKKQQETRHK